MQSNILIAGYGVFGAGLVDHIESNHKNIKIVKIIEPNRHKRDILLKRGYKTCESPHELSSHDAHEAKVVIDCSPRGEGSKNKPIYSNIGLRAIFQNGEEDRSIGALYYPGSTNINKHEHFLMPLCSGISVLKVLSALKKNKMSLPYKILGTHSKVSNTSRMLMPNNPNANSQILELFGVNARMDIVYLRGEPYQNKFTYYGSVQLQYKEKAPSRKDFINSIAEHPWIDIISDKSDLLTNLSIKDKTAIVKESFYSDGKTISFMGLSSTPDVNYPIVIQAVLDIYSMR